MLTRAEWLERLRLANSGLYSAAVHTLVEEYPEYPEVSKHASSQAHYIAMRLDGASHRLAEMIALGKPPMSDTDREFLAGHCNGNQFEGEEWVGDLYQKQALAAGVDPKGKIYLSGLARFPGDPEAWVNGKSDAKRVCEQRGWGAEGAIKVTPRQAAPTQTTIAADLVDSEVNRILSTVPEPDRPYVDTEDLREQVIDRRQPHWS